MPLRFLHLLTALWLSAGLTGCSRSPSYTPPPENGLAGSNEAAVKSQLGQPSHEFAGHYGNPPLDFTEKFTGEVKPSVFTKPGGEVYVSFEKRNGTWIAICNSWLPKGAAF
jgi:hypothetical protein